MLSRMYDIGSDAADILPILREDFLGHQENGMTHNLKSFESKSEIKITGATCSINRYFNDAAPILFYRKVTKSSRSTLENVLIFH